MDVTNNVFKPILNLVVFQNNDPAYGNSKYYIEKRKIINRKLGAASPLDLETVKSLAVEFSKEMQSKIYLDGMIPSNVIYISQRPTREGLIWTYTEKKGTLLFTSDTKIPNGEYSLPNLIFRINYKGHLYVYAYKDEEITDTMKLFRAPFWNTSGDGSICMGNVSINLNQPITARSLMRKAENRFFGSTFTHSSNENNIKGTMQSFISRFHQCNESFDNEILVSNSKTIKSLINESTQGQ